ncbi:MAG: hypothetical protein V4591_03170 [Bdellovibrionota bacterium]
MPFSNGKIKNKYPRTKSPFIVSVNKDETESFMNDIMKEASKLNNKTKNQNKLLFVKSFLIGFFIFLLCFFFLYTSYYFVNHTLLHKQENCRPLS